ncbi:MAG: hypothetical protein HYT03_00975 [Candidatus Harrisonbacteria bacterium]|nr:hypothetical protein [Candidatus Harrisonbacteria bacterium]
MSFSIIQIAHAHEEGATTVTTDNVLGPVLALVIIILAIVVAKRIKKIKKSNQYEQNN